MSKNFDSPIERERFEAWFTKKYPETSKTAWREENNPKYANESHCNIATRERLWECWQARSEARPSVSGLPDEITNNYFEMAEKIINWSPNKESADRHAYRSVTAEYLYLKDKYEAQSSRIVDLESKFAACREEAIKECFVAVQDERLENHFEHLRTNTYTHYGSDDVAYSRAIGDVEIAISKLLSNLRSVAAEETKI